MSRVRRFLKENWIRRYIRVDGDGTGIILAGCDLKDKSIFRRKNA